MKLPPGVNVSEGTAESPSADGGSSGTTLLQDGDSPSEKEATTPAAAADLVGCHFTVVGAARKTGNKSVLASGGREVAGDYLEVELSVKNAGTDLVDLSQYSFRLSGPGIAADTYADYYGQTGTYGAYVADHVISGELLRYSDLQRAACKLKMGEELAEVFLFFDLNPRSTAVNRAVTKENTELVIRKVRGTDYGTGVSIPLAGYPDGGGSE